MNPFSSKMVCAVFGTVIDKVTAFQEILMVTENEPFGEVRIQMVLDPVQFVRPSGRVIPRCCGKDVDIELLRSEEHV